MYPAVYDATLLPALHLAAKGYPPTLRFMVEWDRGGPDRKQKMWNTLLIEAGVE